MRVKRLVSAWLIGLAALSCATATSAGDMVVHPFTKGSFEEIRGARQGHPYILCFWSIHCNYCLKELGMLGELLKAYPDTQLVTVSTDPFIDAQTVQQVLDDAQLDDSNAWGFADDFVERIYFDVDKRWRGELPRTYFVDGENNVLSHAGMVDAEAVKSWLDQTSGNRLTSKD